MSFPQAPMPTMKEIWTTAEQLRLRRSNREYPGEVAHKPRTRPDYESIVSEARKARTIKLGSIRFRDDFMDS